MKPDWTPGFGLPIGTFNITLANLLKNDSTLTINPDSSIKIVFRNDSIAEQSVGEILEIPAQAPSTQQLKLGAISIDNFGSSQTVQLQQLVNNLNPTTASAINQGIALGIPTPFPPIPEQSGGTYNLPQINDFSQVTFSRGALNITLQNGYPTTLDSVVLELRNTGSTTPLGVARFGNIGPNTSQVRSIVLAGRTMQNNIDFGIVKISSAGTAPATVLMSGTQSLTISIAGDTLEVVNGIVRIPSQDFSADTNRVDFATSDNEELYQVDLSTGSVDFSFVSSISEAIRIDINLPAIRINNVPIQRTINILPNSTTNESISLAGAVLDLTTDAQQPYNILPVIVQAALVSSNSLQPIDSSNQLTVSYGINNIAFDLVRGYFGQKNIQISESSLDLNLSFLKELGGSIFLANPNINLNVVNSIGAPIQLTLDMEGKTVAGQSVSLNAPAQTMPFPTVPGNTASGSLVYNNMNSQLAQLLSLPPDTLTTGGLIVLNPNGNQGPNFIANTSSIKIGLEADLPFELSANGIGFGDTSDFNAAETLNGVLEAKLRFKSENRFPFDLVVELTFLDSADATVHSLSAPLVLAAPVDASGRVTGPNNSTSEVLLSRAAMPDIKRAKKMVLRLAMSTAQIPGGRQVVKIYTDYNIIMKLGVEATLRIGDLL
ncbi:MAG: hypothetical protein Q8J69_10515 [Sphingobacteriaceae bacterium]|nr:hypothetical protein [Sphingobacteriaceae bacterium]